MIDVCALTSGRSVPSSRFRMRQHFDELARHGVAVTEALPRVSSQRSRCSWGSAPVRSVGSLVTAGGKIVSRIPGVWASRHADVTWLERGLLPGWRTVEGFLGSPLVLDVDDAIWLRPPHGSTALIKTARQAEIVVAGNDYLADWVSPVARRTIVIPTAIDTDRFVPPSARVGGRRLVVGWTGSASTLPYLEAIDGALAAALLDADAELLVVADRPPSLSAVAPSRVRFTPWSPTVEVTAVQQMDVGLMPLPDDEWARGKCALKLLQYMACGVPYVASPVGVNAGLLLSGGGIAAGSNEWEGALTSLLRDESQRHRLGAKGRAVVVDRFSVPVVAAALADVFRDLAA